MRPHHSHMKPLEVSQLTDMEREFLDRLYGMNRCEQNLQQIGGDLDLTKEEVYQVEKEAFRKLSESPDTPHLEYLMKSLKQERAYRKQRTTGSAILLHQHRSSRAERFAQQHHPEEPST